MAKPRKNAVKAKARKAAKLPLLCCAVLCERVLFENGKLPSLIRVVDVITLKAPETEVEGVELPIRVYISFRKSDSPPARHKCEIGLRDTKGKLTRSAGLEFAFDEKAEANQVANAEMAMKFKWTGFGIYQYELTLDGIRVGVIPFKVVEQQETVEK